MKAADAEMVQLLLRFGGSDPTQTGGSLVEAAAAADEASVKVLMAAGRPRCVPPPPLAMGC